MNKNIILRYLRQENTPEELEQIINWIAESDENRDYLFELEDLWRKKVEFEFIDNTKIDNAFNLFLQNNKLTKDKPSPKRIKLPLWTKYAIVACFASIISTIGYNVFLRTSPINFTTIEVPQGQFSKLILPDSTLVWLNSDSKFSYADNYMDAQNRIVKLEGEAFFDVKRNSEHPFIVQSGGLNVKVLGTEFNVKAYESDAETTVSLISGSIEVSTEKERRKIFPGQVLLFKDNKMQIGQNKSTEATYSWISGELHFEDENLVNIIRAIERKYNVTIHFNSEALENRHLTCKIQKNTSLEDVLDILKNATDLNYNVNDSIITIN